MEIKLYHRAKWHSYCAIVDDIDDVIVRDYTWHLKNDKGRLYAVTIIKINGKRKWVLMHRLIMMARSNEIIDHINGDGLDNRRCNIRRTSYSVNNQNRIKGTDKSSKYTGVCWDKARMKWAAIIQYKSKRINIGRFDKEEDAAMAYDKKAKYFYGEFAKVNFHNNSPAIIYR